MPGCRPMQHQRLTFSVSLWRAASPRSCYALPAHPYMPQIPKLQLSASVFCARAHPHTHTHTGTLGWLLCLLQSQGRLFLFCSRRNRMRRLARCCSKVEPTRHSCHHHPNTAFNAFFFFQMPCARQLYVQRLNQQRASKSNAHYNVAYKEEESPWATCLRCVVLRQAQDRAGPGSSRSMEHNFLLASHNHTW